MIVVGIILMTLLGLFFRTEGISMTDLLSDGRLICTDYLVTRIGWMTSFQRSQGLGEKKTIKKNPHNKWVNKENKLLVKCWSSSFEVNFEVSFEFCQPSSPTVTREIIETKKQNDTKKQIPQWEASSMTQPKKYYSITTTNKPFKIICLWHF